MQLNSAHGRGRLRLLHYETWGEGDPVIALHPLALESSAFAGVAQVLGRQGLRTLAVDLPGFGRTPAPEGPLTAARLAEPVLELARSLEQPPLLIGMSMGGRVALEAALLEPSAFCGVVPVVPYLPWRRWRGGMRLMERVDPDWAERLPLEKVWPLLKRLAEVIEHRPELEHDWLARASVRVIYYSSCPATRVSFLSAVREMALDPAFGPHGLWTRLPGLSLPATFVWAGRDALIPSRHAGDVARVFPAANQLEVPCAGHFVSRGHFRCMCHGIALAVRRTLAVEGDGGTGIPARSARSLAPCLAGTGDIDEELPARPATPRPRAAGARGGSP
jgi:pimeloyl-ACP methyl ester carboxylesterase